MKLISLFYYSDLAAGGEAEDIPVIAVNYPDDLLPRMLEIVKGMERKGILPRVFQRQRRDTIDFLVLFNVKGASVELLGELEEELLEMGVSPYGEALELCILEVMSFAPEAAQHFLRQMEAKGFYLLRILKFLNASQARVFWEAKLLSLETDLSRFAE